MTMDKKRATPLNAASTREMATELRGRRFCPSCLLFSFVAEGGEICPGCKRPTVLPLPKHAEIAAQLEGIYQELIDEWVQGIFVEMRKERDADET